MPATKTQRGEQRHTVSKRGLKTSVGNTSLTVNVKFWLELINQNSWIDIKTCTSTKNMVMLLTEWHCYFRRNEALLFWLRQHIIRFGSLNLLYRSMMGWQRKECICCLYVITNQIVSDLQFLQTFYKQLTTSKLHVTKRWVVLSDMGIGYIYFRF